MHHSQQKSTKLSNTAKDAPLWILVGLIVAVLIVGNLWLSSSESSLRVLLSLGLVVVGLGLSALTTRGKAVLAFIRAARSELRKVVWPSRKETLQVSLLVFVLVLAMALILWAVDSVFALLVSAVLV